MKKIILLLSISTILLSGACKKNKDAHVPPDLAFKTTSGYTSADVTINQGDSILVGVVITKKEDDLRTLNISYAYDGASSSTTHLTYSMTAAEYTGFDHDYYLVSRNQAGTEKWIFTVTDRDGNLAQKSITLTVQ
ncbi:hypothetical protein BH09BAC5_BH09BAC5_09930 [soil metagenome]